jgi:hypothetical protein
MAGNFYDDLSRSSHLNRYSYIVVSCLYLYLPCFNITTRTPGSADLIISRVPRGPITPNSHSPTHFNDCFCIPIVADHEHSLSSMSGDCLGNHICRVRSSHCRRIMQQSLALWQLRHNIPHLGPIGSFVVLGYPEKVNVGRFVCNLREARSNASSSGEGDNPRICVYISARERE